MPDEVRLKSAVIELLYERHGDHIRRFLLGLLRDPQLAEDVLQATFTKAIEVAHQTATESRKAWLFRVAYNEAMAVKRRDAVGRRAIQKVADQHPAESVVPEEPLVRRESVEAVRAALVELPPEQQRIVRMRIYEEKTFAVIAKELDIPLGTALGRMRSAQQKLMERLRRTHGPERGD